MNKPIDLKRSGYEMDKCGASRLRTCCRLSLLAAALLTACASTPETHFYVLSASSHPSPVLPQASPKRLIGLGPVTVPAHLERRQIVTRSGDNRVTASEFHQWAASLKESITETLTQNLSALLPNDIVRAYPWSIHGDVEYHVVVDIVRFESDVGQSARLIANWSIVDDKTHAPVIHGRTDISHPHGGPGYEAAVKALSETLASFGRQLADALLSLKPSTNVMPKN